MAEKRWEFELDGARHTVELEHNTFSDKQSVRVDGRLLQSPAGAPGGHPFRIGGHACEVVVAKKGGKYVYDFLIDGVSSTPEKYSQELAEVQSSERMKGMRWAAIVIFLALGLGGNWINWYWLHTKGFYYDELALLAPALAFIGLYWIFFPKDYVAQFSGITVRMWVAIVIAFLLGFANMYAFSHWLY